MNMDEQPAIGARTSEPLRLAILLERDQQPAWIGAMIERVKALAFVEICLVILQPQPAGSNKSSLLWSLYRRADDRLFGKAADTLASTDISALLTGIARIEINQEVGEAKKLVQHSIDVLLDTRPGGTPDPFAEIARFGVWRYEFGDTRLPDLSAVGRREVADRAPLTVSRLVSHLRGGEIVCLYQSQARTVPFSPRRNRDNTLWKCVAFTSRALAALHQSQSIPKKLDCASQAQFDEQASVNIPALLARTGTRLLGRALQKMFFLEQWFIAFKFDVDTIPPHSFADFEPIAPPSDRFWADPFPIERDGRYYIFIEELPFASNKGHISVLEVHPDGTWTQPVKVLERDYHLSYPFLFEWEGALFMLPESGHNRSVEVYRCHHFPDDWRLEAVLLEDLRCADATMAQIADRWWMFVNIAEKGTELYDELHIYHAEQPFGPWTPHNNNPVKSDARSARPAGNLFWHDGLLYRPAQCCVPLYGSALSLNVVDRLTTDEFVEHQVVRCAPDWRPRLLGLHTFNRAGRLSVIDCLQQAPKIGAR